MAKKPTTAAPDMFATAAVVPAKPKGKAKTDDRATHAVVGLEDYALVGAAIKNFEAVQETLLGPIKVQLRDQFIEAGTAAKKRPDNYRGLERTASASCEFRKRGANQPLNEAEIAAFERHGIPTEEVVIVPAAFIINPKYIEDRATLAKVSEVLLAAGIPADLFMKQEKQSKICVPDSALDVIFTKKPDVIEKMLDSVCVLAIKPKLEEEVEIVTVLEAAAKLVKGEEAGEAKED